MKHLFRCLILLACCACAGNAAADANALIGTCEGCHGEKGVSQWSDMPTIAGIDGFAHSEALYAYRDQARPCATSNFRRGDTSRGATSMCEVAADLSDDDIEDIASHYAALPFVAAKQEFDPDLAAAGEEIHDRECALCHSEGGSNPEDESSILAGQWMGYLEATFAQYASGDREQTDKMKEKLDSLSPADVKALVHYYASQQ